MSEQQSGEKVKKSEPAGERNREAQEAGKQYDWLDRPRQSAQLLYMIANDAVTIFLIACIAQALTFGFGLLDRSVIEWSVNGVKVSLEEIAHYGDLATFVAFFAVAAWHLIRWTVGK